LVTNPIKAGNLGSADTVLNYPVAQLFKNQSQLLFNAARIGFNSKLNVATGVPNLKNIKYDCMLSDTATTNTGFVYNATDDLWTTELYLGNGDGMSTYDDFENASIDGTKWAYTSSSGTGVTESAGVLKGEKSYASANNQSWEYSTLQFDDFDYMIFNMSSIVTNGGGGEVPTVRISVTGDSGLDSTAKQWSGPNLTTNTSGYFYVYKAGNKVYTQWSSDGWVEHDVTGKTNLQIKFSGGGTYYTNQTCSCSHSYYYTWSSVPTLIFQTTSLPTVTDCLATWNATIDGDNTLTVSISANGSNYETVTDATIKRFTNTGTNLYVKFALTKVDGGAADKISEYAVWYNLGAA
jgi:hypothetical protein